ncbi:MAG TPA: Ldh family oxidoreductase [Candidatus Saccharimonadales bacterium]|nr:Ldh family oxidoreductase [Candidatus Saccharimonadales bacterium]
MKAVPIADLEAFVLDVLDRSGVSRKDAQTTAEVLVTTDSWGVFTHGTKFLSDYTRRLRAGGLNPRGRPAIQKEGPAWALVDGDRSLGMVTGVFAMNLAVAKATASGIALVTVHNSYHFGAAGYYAWIAASQGRIGLALANAIPSVSAPGSCGPVLGSNPFAFAAPAAKEGSMVLDISTAAVAGGKIMVAAAEGKPVPASWLIDAKGQPTTDPHLFLRFEAFLTPMAAHKGYGLALMIEILSGVLSGGAMRDKIGSFVDLPDKPADYSQAFLAINPEVFLGENVFAGRVDDLFGGIRHLPSAVGFGHVKIPGEIEQEKRRKALASGIDLPADVVDVLRMVAEESGCRVPEFLEKMR